MCVCVCKTSKDTLSTALSDYHFLSMQSSDQ